MHTLKLIAKHTIFWILVFLPQNISTIRYGRPISNPWLFNHFSLVIASYLVVAATYPAYLKRKKLILSGMAMPMIIFTYIFIAFFIDKYFMATGQLKPYKIDILDYSEARFARVIAYILFAWYYASKKAALKRSSILLNAERSLKVVAISEAVQIKKVYEKRVSQLEAQVIKAMGE